jgi:hypothetical protein
MRHDCNSVAWTHGCCLECDLHAPPRAGAMLLQALCSRSSLVVTIMASVGWVVVCSP